MTVSPYQPNPVVAAEWLRRHLSLSLPVCAATVAHRLGIATDLALLPPYRAGYLLRDQEGKYIILLNSRDSPARRNWTCAHEIGHYIMHRHRHSLCASGRNVDMESEADRFAAELLMPAESVAILALAWNVRELAAALHVSTAAARKRIREVGARPGTTLRRKRAQ